jgi:hypothetical protein
VKLMNRIDSKFNFNISNFEKIIKEVQPYYKILEVDGSRLVSYKTLYYDTPNFGLYTKHHNGILNRYKIRHRTYLESDIGFLEVKFKNNKGRTIKTRISHKNVPVTWQGESETFLNKMVPFETQSLCPVLWVNYKRLTLVNRNSTERLTIDLNLEFVNGCESMQFNKIVLGEVKQDCKKLSPFIETMKKYHIREGSISKYCMGMALTQKNIKINNFKPRLLTINQLNNA